MRTYTAKEIKRVKNSLDEARKEGNAKRITFLEATLRLYTKANKEAKR